MIISLFGFFWLCFSVRSTIVSSRLVLRQDLDLEPTSNIFDETQIADDAVGEQRDDDSSVEADNGDNNFGEQVDNNSFPDLTAQSAETAADQTVLSNCVSSEDGDDSGGINEFKEDSLAQSTTTSLDADESIAGFSSLYGTVKYLRREVENMLSPYASESVSLKKNESPSTSPAICPQKVPNPRSRSNDICDPRNSKSCEKATAQIIYPRACGATEDNNSVTSTLHQMVGGTSKVGISRDKRCGIFFWATKLKPSQVQRLKKLNAVGAVAPDGKLQSYIQKAKSAQASDEFTDFPAKSRRLKKRSNVVSQKTSSDRDLAYISQPYGMRLGDKYTHFSEAGRGTTAYIVGDGVNPLNDEFIRNSNIGRGQRSIITDWLFGLGARSTESTQSGESSIENSDMTSCAASKVAGETEGVASEASLVVVKILVDISSYLDGIQKVIDHLRDRLRLSPGVKGHNVLLLLYGWTFEDRFDVHQRKLKQLIETLMSSELQVVVVTAAGTGDDEVVHVDSVPAMYSMDEKTPLITVGGINQFTGARPWGTPTGSAVTIVAPYGAVCAGNGRDSYNVHLRGTGVSASIVAGLILYFMSLEADGVGQWMTSSRNVPLTARTYLLLKGYSRGEGQDRAAWNGLSPDPGASGTHGWDAFARGGENH